MSDMTVEQFCDRHDACSPGREWAMAHCETMADVWATAKPEWLVWVATRRGVLTDRELRLFAVWSARQVQHLMADARSIAALNVAERHANGEAANEELAAARDAAWRAVWADETADETAAWAAARAAAWADETAARTAAWAAAGAARAAAGADETAARTAAWAAQAEWIRANTLPNFEMKEGWR